MQLSKVDNMRITPYNDGSLHMRRLEDSTPRFKVKY